MRASAAFGKPVDYGAGPFELTEMKTWADGRTVRAEVLRYLLTNDKWPVDAKGVQLRGVRVSGQLDLEAATLRCPLHLHGCYFDAEEPVRVNQAVAPAISLANCVFAGLTGDQLKTGALDLTGSTLNGPLDLRGGNIGGDLTCGDTHLNCDDDYALSADGIRVGGSVFLMPGFTAEGPIRLLGADIGGQLACRGAQLNGQDREGRALVADRIVVKGSVFLGWNVPVTTRASGEDRSFTAAGAVCLTGAVIGGQLVCRGAQLKGRESARGCALIVNEATIGGDVVLDMKFTTTAGAGAVRLVGAGVGGQLVCSDAHLDGHDGDGNALVADRIKTGSDVLLNEGFTASGAVQLAGADITGTLRCRGAKLTGHDNHGRALYARGMRVGGDAYLDEGFTSDGTVRLTRADITGTLRCRDATLTGRDETGYALYARGIKVGGDVYLDGKFTADGTVRLTRADITGQLSCGGARLTGRDNDRNALLADRVSVGGDVVLNEAFTASGTISLASARAGTLRWAPASQISCQVNLEGATVDELDDDWGDKRTNGHWPADGRLRLDGFIYRRFSGQQQPTVDQRLDWIRGQYQRDTTRGTADFATQPYEQLATVYREAGQDAQARKAAIARRADLRKYQKLNRYRRIGNLLLDKTIKYGYQAWRAGVALAIVFLMFAAASFFAQDHHLMVPVGNTQGLHPPPVATRCTSSYPCFYPLGYAIDTVIPIINVHQSAYWGPDGHAPWGWAWVAGTWAATALGWALVTLLVAGYTGLVRQE